MNEKPLLQQTLRTVGIMVGACVAFLGVISITCAVLLRSPSSSTTTTSADTPKVATTTTKVH